MSSTVRIALMCSLSSLLAVGCASDDAPFAPATPSLRLLDRDARAASAAPTSPLPVTSDGDPGTLEYVHPDGDVELLRLGDDVDPDRLRVDADERAARSLADQLGADVTLTNDGLWELHADQMLERAAAADPVDDLFESMPVELGDADASPSSAAPRAITAAPAAPTAPAAHLTVATAIAPIERCADPVVGDWVATTYRTEAGDWYRFTLHVERKSHGKLRGSIDAQIFNDDPATATSPARRVGMSGAGTVNGASLSFHATALKSDAFDYDLDAFTGTLDDRGAYHAVNNDGDSAHDRPYVFHRSGC